MRENVSLSLIPDVGNVITMPAKVLIAYIYISHPYLCRKYTSVMDNKYRGFITLTLMYKQNIAIVCKHVFDVTHLNMFYIYVYINF